MPVLRIVLTALCLVLSLLPGPVAAEERGERFLDLMSNLPQDVWSNRSRSIPEFFDFEAAATVVGVLATSHPGKVRADAQRVITGPFPNAPSNGDWSLTVGFARSDLRAAVAVQDEEDRRTVLFIKPDVVAAVAPALLAHGYVQSDDRGFPAFWRIADDFGFDMAFRNRDDPFAAGVPLSSRIALEGDMLLHARGWPGLQSMIAAKGPNTVLAAFASALNMPDWGDRAIVQTVIFSDPMLFAPGIRLGDGLNPVPPPPGEVPYWSNMMLADLSDGTSDLTLVVLLYIARSDAEAAAKAMQDGLASAILPSFGDKALAEVAGVGQAMVAGEGPYLAIYTIETDPDIRSDFFPSNRGYSVLLNAAFMRELYLLGPAMP
jgi:hypothetical protein